MAQPNRKQRVFVDWVLGTLLYAVVLGFFPSPSFEWRGLLVKPQR